MALDGGVETPLDELVRLLDLTPADAGAGSVPDAWIGEHSAQALTTGHVFGGLVLAQAVRAAARTVDAGRRLHSLHALFLRAGTTDRPVRYEVTRLRDGRRLSHRRVEAVQAGVICELLLGFAADGPERRLMHADAAAPTDVDPELLPRDQDALADHPEVPFALRSTRPIDLRYARHPQLVRDAGERAEVLDAWFRADGPLPEDPVLHVCLAVYASDLLALEPVASRQGVALRSFDVSPASLDHALWLHAPVRADRWLRARLDSPWADEGRGLGRVSVHQDGVRVMEVVQEGLLVVPEASAEA